MKVKKGGVPPFFMASCGTKSQMKRSKRVSYFTLNRLWRCRVPLKKIESENTIEVRTNQPFQVPITCLHLLRLPLHPLP